MIDVKRATDALGGLALLKYFPADKSARAELVAMVCEMAESNEQIEWLVKRARNLWREWEGPRELRAVFCSRFRPADGIECYSSLPQFAEHGIPSESPELALITGAASEQRGQPVSAAQSLHAAVCDLARAKSLNRIGPATSVREIPVRQITDANRITEADVRLAEQELREKKAREAIGAEP